jgi:hypothetical protein
MKRVSTSQAAAEVFCTAFRSLPREGRQAVVARLMQERQFREDLVDLSILRERRHEPVRSLESYMAQRKKARSN